jgi:hypothetical protein
MVNISFISDDNKDSFKDAISNARVHNYSAPPTIMTLYDYDVISFITKLSK